MKITRVRVQCVGPEITRYTWSHDLPEQYMTNTIVIIDTDDGVQGIGATSNYTSYCHDRYTGECIRHLIPKLVGNDPLDRESIWTSMWPRVFPLPPGAIAAVDIALWDIFGKIESQPIYKLLGGTRDKIPAYASTPMFDSVPAYLDFISDMAQRGFKAVKFHCWCDPIRDLELARAVHKEFGNTDLRFMLDVENNYTRDQAMKAAKELEQLDFEWFEAPLFDYDLDGYREITSAVDLAILPSGNWIQDRQAFANALDSNAWSVARTDVTMTGGFTEGIKWLDLVDEAQMRCEIMAWGFTLVSTANLHLMLSRNSCTYFEQAVPYDSYQYGMKDVIQTDNDGFVRAPDKPGLGVEVDWDAMDAATFNLIDSNQ
ncbi:MAG: mandelate racemase/muconate lactonizing enzyme family protein [Pirellulales bacterium]|nr:mandelate racemase/muconate lactonizing enzyme family protein [Pirellulales bacterium]